MRKKVTLILSLCSAPFVFSQVGINTTSPQATLDVTAKTTNGSKPEGIIAPRLTGDQIRSADGVYSSAQQGMIIYATTAVTSPLPGSKTENILAAGYYYFDGTKWQKMAGGTGSVYTAGNGLTLAGNTMALGGNLTADTTIGLGAHDLNFTGSGNIKTSGSVISTDGYFMPTTDGSATLNPGTGSLSGYLDIRKPGNTRIGYVGFSDTNMNYHAEGSGIHEFNNQIKINGGFPAAGKVLTSDANGLASWTMLSDNNTTYTAGSGLTLTGTVFSANDATATTKGIVQLAGDLTGTSASPSVADGAVTSAKIADGTITANDIANNAVSIAKLPAGASAATFLRGDGSWATPAGAIYTGSSSIKLNGSSFEREALTGDVIALANSNSTTIADNAVTTAKIADGTITANDIANNAVSIAKLPAGASAATFLRGDGSWATPAGATNTATNGITLTGNNFALGGSLTANTTINQGTFTLGFTGTGAISTGGSLTASQFTTPSGQGKIMLTPGGASNAGYIELFKNNGTTRLGYIGYDNVNMSYNAEPGAIHVFNTTIQTPRVQGSSDRRFKDHIQKINQPTEKLNQLNGYTYTWRDKKDFPGQVMGEGKDMGVIAQEVEKVFPDAVSTNKEGYKSVNYNALIPVLIEALKESNKKIENLERRLKHIESTKK